MYDIAIALQYIGIIVAVVGAILIYPKKSSVQKHLMNIILFGVLITEVGYLFELQSTTMEAAIVSIKIAYLGKMFAELGILLFVFRYTDIKLPKWLPVLLAIFHTFIVGLVWTCENNTLFYKSIGYTTEGLFPHVVLEYGIVYHIFTVVTILYMAIILILCVLRFIQKKELSERIRMLCLSTPPITTTLGLFAYRLGITQGYDTTVLTYVICAAFFIFTIMKYDLINEKALAEELILEEFSEAVLVLDSKNQIVYVNKQFSEIYGDYKKNPDVKKSIISHSKNNQELKKGDSYYSVISKELFKSDDSIGHMYVLRDVTDAHMRMELVKNYNQNLEHDVALKTKSLIDMQNQMILGMANMVENRDYSTGGHIKRTSRVVEILIDEIKKDKSLKLDEKFCSNIIKAAPMHDLGKIAVDDIILRKVGKYTIEEYEIMKTHSAKGAQIVNHILESYKDRDFARVAENVAHYHHERVDGTGYPEHLKGGEIPFEARIMAIADVYDALVSKRCYKKALSFEEAFKIIEEGMGTQFDSMLEPYFVACRSNLEEYYSTVVDED